MPRKISRQQTTELSTPRESRYDIEISNSGLAAIGVGMTSLAVGMTAKAAADVYSSTANLVATTVRSLADCATAYANYATECQRTRQVEIWSYTVLEEARERTHQMEIQAEAAKEVQEARQARMEIVRYFLDQHNKVHASFTTGNEAALGNLSIEERTTLVDHRDTVLKRLRELEMVLSELAKTL